MNKAYLIKLYPNKTQEQLINQTIGNCRKIYNEMLSERIAVYEKLKNDKEKLYAYEYKTEKEYKQEFPFLSLGSHNSLQQSRRNLISAFTNFFRGLKKNKHVGFPKFKSKHHSINSYREPQGNPKRKTPLIRIKNNKLNLNKIGYVKFRGLSKSFTGTIKSVTITKLKDNTYQASILTEQEQTFKQRKGNGVVGIDLGLIDFITLSTGEKITGILNHIFKIDKKIAKLQQHFSRKPKPEKFNPKSRREKLRIKIAKQHKYKSNFQKNFFFMLANQLCNENQVIGIENLNVSGMKKNKKLSGRIHNVSWSTFINILKLKAVEYQTEIVVADRFFPSSKTCSSCGLINENLTLDVRTWICECGSVHDRDVNAAINLKKLAELNSQEYCENTCGEDVRLEADLSAEKQSSVKRELVLGAV